MTRHHEPPPPEVGLSAVEHWRIIFAIVIAVMCTALVVHTILQELG